MHTLGELAEYVGGRVVGDPHLEIARIQPFEAAQPGDLTLALERRYRDHLAFTRASAVIVPESFASAEKPLLQVANPKLAFARLLGLFHDQPFVAAGISPLACVGKHCRIAENVTIHPFVCVGDEVTIENGVTVFSGVHVGHRCVIGRGSVLHPNVVLYDGVSLGRRVVIHGGTVIGADGFGYVFDGQQQVKIPQTGTVIIEDDVEIGANSCVDRATFGATVIEKGVKLDNHVHIGHNCRIGEHTIMVAQVGLSGSVEVGKNCVFAGHAGVVHQVKIGDRVTVTAKTAVTKDVPSDSVVSGHPALPHREWMKVQALMRRLPELMDRPRKKKREKSED